MRNLKRFPDCESGNVFFLIFPILIAGASHILERIIFESILHAIVSLLSWVCGSQRFKTQGVVGSEEPCRLLDSAAVEMRSELSLRKKKMDRLDVLWSRFRSK